jgi:hypothetical protein
MGLRDLLRAPKVARRTRSEPRNEIISEPIEGPSNVHLAVPQFAESTPALEAGASTLLPSSPLISHGKELTGVYTASSPSFRAGSNNRFPCIANHHAGVNYQLGLE